MVARSKMADQSQFLAYLRVFNIFFIFSFAYLFGCQNNQDGPKKIKLFFRNFRNWFNHFNVCFSVTYFLAPRELKFRLFSVCTSLVWSGVWVSRTPRILALTMTLSQEKIAFQSKTSRRVTNRNALKSL
jgi:hypothetical protein